MHEIIHRERTIKHESQNFPDPARFSKTLSLSKLNLGFKNTDLG